MATLWMWMGLLLLVGTIVRTAAQECDFMSQLLPLAADLDSSCTTMIVGISGGGAVPPRDTICGCMLQLTNPPDCTISALNATVTLSAFRTACAAEAPETTPAASTPCPASSGRPTVLLMGDSMAAFSEQIIGEFCTNEDVYNVAVGGMTAATYIATVPDTNAWLPACVDPTAVESIWLSIGGNDFLGANCPQSSQFQAPLVVALNGMIASLQSSFPNAGIVLTGYPIPMVAPVVPGVVLSGCTDIPTMHYLNDIHAQVAEATAGATYVNFTNVLGGDWNSFSNADLFADAIHPNALGFCTMGSMGAFQDAIGCDGLGRVRCTLPPSGTASDEPTAAPTTSEPTAAPAAAVTAPQCLDIADATGAMALLTPLQATPGCEPFVAALLATVLPLAFSNPERVGDALYDVVEAEGRPFCNCMAGMDSAGIAQFFPTDGCVLGEFSAGDIVDTCAEVESVDVTAPFCLLACYGSSTAFFGSADDEICCQCGADAAAPLIGCPGVPRAPTPAPTPAPTTSGPTTSDPTTEPPSGPAPTPPPSTPVTPPPAIQPTASAPSVSGNVSSATGTDDESESGTMTYLIIGACVVVAVVAIGGAVYLRSTRPPPQPIMDNHDNPVYQSATTANLPFEEVPPPQYEDPIPDHDSFA